MQYFVKRGEQRFGPYSLSDLQKYVQSGNITGEDLTQSEGMPDWVPVSQVLGNIPATAVTSGGAAVAPAPEPELVPLPPNFHWAIVLLLGIATLGLFNILWALIQANWARRLIKDNKPLALVAMYPAGVVTVVMMTAFRVALVPLVNLITGIVYLVGIFSIRSAMEDYYNSTENIGLSLSGVMTFFFSTVYLQYHVNRIARWKRTGALS